MCAPTRRRSRRGASAARTRPRGESTRTRAHPGPCPRGYRVPVREVVQPVVGGQPVALRAQRQHGHHAAHLLLEAVRRCTLRRCAMPVARPAATPGRGSPRCRRRLVGVQAPAVEQFRERSRHRVDRRAGHADRRDLRGASTPARRPPVCRSCPTITARSTPASSQPVRHRFAVAADVEPPGGFRRCRRSRGRRGGVPRSTRRAPRTRAAGSPTPSSPGRPRPAARDLVAAPARACGSVPPARRCSGAPSRGECVALLARQS